LKGYTPGFVLGRLRNADFPIIILAKPVRNDSVGMKNTIEIVYLGGVHYELK